MKEKILQVNREKILFHALVGILVLCAGFYMYFINATVHNVVARQNFETESSQLTLAIGSEEFQYISKRNSVTLDLAYSMGYKDVSKKTYISRAGTTRVAMR